MSSSSRTHRSLRHTLFLGAGLILLLLSKAPAFASPPTQGRRAVPTDSLTATHVAFALRYDASLTRRPASDRWFARDKARHVAFSALWTLSTQYVLVSKADWSEGDALPLSIGSAAAVGLAKELYDRQTPEGRISARDLIANAVGIGLAVGLISL